MNGRSTIALLSLIAPLSAAAQQHTAGGAPGRSVPAEAKQFDFMVGQWELVVRPQGTSLAARIHGLPRMAGTLKAWRALDGWGVTDELRITDGSGNPRSLTYAVRMYDAATRRWRSSTADVYRGTFNAATADWSEGRMTVMSTGTDAEGKPYLSRGRYTNITPTSFKFEQERSLDDGATWTKNLIIEAKRVAAAAPR